MWLSFVRPHRQPRAVSKTSFDTRPGRGGRGVGPRGPIAMWSRLTDGENQRVRKVHEASAAGPREIATDVIRVGLGCLHNH